MESCNWWFRACIWWQNPYRGISAQRQRGKGSMFAILFGSPGWKAQSWITKILRLEPSVWVVSMRNLLYPSHLRKAPLRIVSYIFGQCPNRFWPHPFLSNKQLFAWLVLYRSTSKHPPRSPPSQTGNVQIHGGLFIKVLPLARSVTLTMSGMCDKSAFDTFYHMENDEKGF